MAKILRKYMKIFGSNAGPNQRGVFGSLAAGLPAFSDDPETIQSLPNYLEGWYGAVLGNNSPAIQDMNALQFLYAYQLAYGMQAGVAEWDDETTYYIGSFAQVAGVIYVSIADDNLNHAVSDPTKWLPGIATASIQDLAVTTAKIDNLAVTTGKIAAGAVTDAKTTFTAPTNSWSTGGSQSGGFAAGSSGDYTTPAGVKWIKVRMVGGGGGGGGTGSGTTLAGDGGGAGCYIEFIIVNPAATIAFTIGAGGAGGTAGFNNGSAGTGTVFGARTAGAGSGGGAGSNTGHNTGGAGGTATGTSVGDLIIGGTTGLAMSSGNQNRSTGGQGGSTPFGQGGSGGVATNAGAGFGGQAGIGFGSGGGGAGGGTGSAAGGAGAGGLIYNDEFYV